MFISPAISAATIALKYDGLKRGPASAVWPSTRCKVLNSELATVGKQKETTIYHVQLEVAYKVGEEIYKMRVNALDSNGRHQGVKRWARELSLAQKPGSILPLYYNPTKPKQITLQPGQVTVNGRKWSVINAIMLLFSFILHILSILALSRQFLNITTASSVALGLITFFVMIMLGVLLYLLTQELRSQSPT
ncbi:MAG: DUF3592 domain-containing protein [Chloroflexi bacterium]|nr:DUF3592 domain-containing protein [Chloroflexota bacterium]